MPILFVRFFNTPLNLLQTQGMKADKIQEAEDQFWHYEFYGRWYEAASEPNNSFNMIVESAE